MKKTLVAAIAVAGIVLLGGCSVTEDSDTGKETLVQTFSVDDHDAIRQRLSNSQWCMANKNSKTKMPVTFNADVTLINEGTPAEGSIELKKNELHYLDPDTPASNYTRFEAEYSGYLLTHTIYANGMAKEEVRFYKKPSDAQAWIDTLK